MSKIYQQEPQLLLDGVSVTKRCMQLFDARYLKNLDRKASLAIQKEKQFHQKFDSFSTSKKLKILDESRMGKQNRSAKKASNIKWQLNGVLDKYHLPKKDAEKTSVGFKIDVDEISKVVNHKKSLERSMQGMSVLKLKSMCEAIYSKMGLVNRTQSTQKKIGLLVEELAAASTEKKKARRLQRDSPSLSPEEGIVTFIGEPTPLGHNKTIYPQSRKGNLPTMSLLQVN